MAKGTKKWQKIFAWIVAGLLLLALLPGIAVRIPLVQEYLKEQILSLASKKLEARIEAGHVSIAWFLDVVLQDVVVFDHNQDTMLLSPRIQLDVGTVKIRKKEITIDKISLLRPDVKLLKYPEDSLTNWNRIIQRFTKAEDDTVTTDWKIMGLALNVIDGRFSYHNYQIEPDYSEIDYDHVDMDSVFLYAEFFEQQGDSTRVAIYHMALRERSGFVLDSLHTIFSLSDHTIRADNLYIKAGSSSLLLDLQLSYNDWSEFRSFIDSVHVRADIAPSRLNMKDLGPFAQELKDMDNTWMLSGFAEGTVAAFRLKDLEAAYGNASVLRGNFSLAGLPDIREMFVDADIQSLNLDVKDLKQFQLPGSSRLPVLPSWVDRLDGSRVIGSFTGFYNDFVATVKLQTPFGLVFADMVLNRKNGRDGVGYTYDGMVRTPGFNVGQLSDASQYVGMVSMNMGIKGQGINWENLNAEVSGRIDSVELMGDNYRAFDISGNLLGKRFQGFLSINDPKLGMDFNGTIDLSNPIPAFDFLAIIDHARIDKLSRNAVSFPLLAAAEVRLEFSGDHIDRLDGSLHMTNLSLTSPDKEYTCQSIELDFVPDDKRYKEIRLRSDPVDIDISGSFTLQETAKGLNSQFAHLLPSAGFHRTDVVLGEAQRVIFELRVNDLDPLLALFQPDLSIQKGSSLVMGYNGEEPFIDWKLNSDMVVYQGIKIHSLHLEGKANQDSASLWLNAPLLSMTDSLEVFSVSLKANTRQDSILFSLGWESAADADHRDGLLAGLIDFPSVAKARLRLRESKIPLDANEWSFNPQHSILFDSTGIEFSDVRLQSKDQLIRLSGKASKDADHLLDAQFNNFDLGLLNVLLRRYEIDMAGKIDGDVGFSSLLSKPDIRASLLIRDFHFNGDRLGDAKMQSTWDPINQSLFLDARVSYQGNAEMHIPLEITGFYYPDDQKGRLDLNARVKDFKLQVVERYVSGVFSDIEGYVSGEIQISGPMDNLQLNGKAMARRTGFRVDYLNESYSFSHEILIRPDAFYFNDLVLNDARGNRAVCQGKVSHQKFRDFRLEFEAKPVEFSSLNTTLAMNEMFYGRATLTGDVRITGPFDDLTMNIKGETGKGTSLHLPISYQAEVLENQFISFYEPDKPGQVDEPRKLNLSGLRLDFQFTAKPEAEVEILLPSRMGNIKGNGEGELRFIIDTRGEFSMFGDYVIDGGVYQMTLQNLLNRRFDLRKGGRISFSGDPYDATINVSAIYRVRASLSELRPVGDSSSIYRQRIPVNCVIHLTDRLINPQISFGIELPDSREEVNRLVFNRIDTTNAAQLNRQIISLLVLNSFMSEEANVNLASGVSSSSFELLTKQLSNWLSQISKDFDIGVNYRPGDELTNEELELALSTQLFNDRVLIDGNFGMAGERKTQEASNLVGDVQIEVKLTEDGRFRVKAFNRSNYVNLLDNKAPYTQGIGVFYRKEFDQWKEILMKRRKSDQESEI